MNASGVIVMEDCPVTWGGIGRVRLLPRAMHVYREERSFRLALYDACRERMQAIGAREWAVCGPDGTLLFRIVL